MANLTNKNIDFLSNRDLVEILKSVLLEIDILSSSGAHRAATYLGVSTIEGLFGELFSLLKIQPSMVRPGVWPTYSSGKEKKVADLRLFEMEDILADLDALPEDFKDLYGRIRQYRNYMHPTSELRKLKPINQSIGQLTVACLNALIEKYELLRFVADYQWRLEYGQAQVPVDNVINMPQKPGEYKSLIICEPLAEYFREMTFRVIIPRDAIFNFIYNYFSKDQFMGARIEGRIDPNGMGADNGRLQCTKWDIWSINGRYTHNSEPNPQMREHSIQVIFDPPEKFKVVVDGTRLELADGVEWDYDPHGKVGFMTEWGLVSVMDLELMPK